MSNLTEEHFALLDAAVAYRQAFNQLKHMIARHAQYVAEQQMPALDALRELAELSTRADMLISSSSSLSQELGAGFFEHNTTITLEAAKWTPGRRKEARYNRTRQRLRRANAQAQDFANDRSGWTQAPGEVPPSASSSQAMVHAEPKEGCDTMPQAQGAELGE